MNIEKNKVKTKEKLEICSKLRKEVFGDEECAPEQLYIIDEFDNNIDTPITVENEIKILSEIGFKEISSSNVDKADYSLIKARKRNLI